MMSTFNRRGRLIRLRWQMANQSLRLTIQTAAAAVAGIAIFAVLRSTHAIDAATASLIVAAVLGIATVLQQRRQQRQQYTVDLISAFQTEENLAAADTWMTSRIASGVAVTANISDSDESFVVALLDYYEFLAILAEQGVINTSIILHLRGSTMTRCFRLCAGYIEDRRTRLGPELYQGMETFILAARLSDLNHSRDATSAPLEAPVPRIPDGQESPSSAQPSGEAPMV